MRASLASGNLITGSLFIALDFHENANPTTLSTLDEYTVMPTIATGFDQLQLQLSSVLEKLQKLPLEDTVNSATTALNSIKLAVNTADRTLGDVNGILENPNTQAIPKRLDSMLAELSNAMSGMAPGSSLYNELESALASLEDTLRSARELTETLDKKPNALVFSPTAGPDTVPEVKR